KMLPIGSSFVLILLTSYQTYLTNFSVDKKLWPLFYAYWQYSRRNSKAANSPNVDLDGPFPTRPQEE
ncbi:hypothetical protein BGX38DRAFT_1104114, partial [Terfezia claveryi]